MVQPDFVFDTLLGAVLTVEQGMHLSMTVCCHDCAGKDLLLCLCR